MQTPSRCKSARAAALAGSGQGKDDPPLDEPTKARWRKQAIDWLKADQAAWSKRGETGDVEASIFRRPPSPTPAMANSTSAPHDRHNGQLRSSRQHPPDQDLAKPRQRQRKRRLCGGEGPVGARIQPLRGQCANLCAKCFGAVNVNRL